MIVLLVALSICQNVIADNEAHYLDLGPLLASLRAAERAADEVAAQLKQKDSQKPGYPKNLNINEEDMFKEKKLRQILELVKEHNRALPHDVNDESRGPRVFMIKEDRSGGNDKVPEHEVAETKVTRRLRIERANPYYINDNRRSLDPKVRDEIKKKLADINHRYQKHKLTKGKKRSYDDDEGYTSNRNYENAGDISRELDAPKPLLRQFPKYTDGVLHDRNDWKRTPMGPYEKPKGIPFNTSKEEPWDNIERSNKRKKIVADDDSLDRSSDSNRSRGLYRSKNRLFGRTPIPYMKRYVYED